MFKKRWARNFSAIVVGIFVAFAICIGGLIMLGWFKEPQTVRVKKLSQQTQLTEFDSALAAVVEKNSGEGAIEQGGRETILTLFPPDTGVNKLVNAFKQGKKGQGHCTMPDEIEQYYPGLTEKYGRVYRCYRRFHHPLSTTVIPGDASEEEAHQIVAKAIKENPDPYFLFSILWRVNVSLDESEQFIEDIVWIDFGLEGP